jgi:DNA-binding transcriptional MerR regulator
VSDRTYLSIGDVLALLRDEFPDITISKIRFLESRGLLDPERTPSGYRKFYEADVDRLRWILRQQREHFLPLKIIKGRLEGSSTAEDPPSLFDVAGDPAPELAEHRALVGAFAWSRGPEAAAEAAGPWPRAAYEAGAAPAAGPAGREPAGAHETAGRPVMVTGADEPAPPAPQGAEISEGTGHLAVAQAGEQATVAEDPSRGGGAVASAPIPAPVRREEGADELTQPTGGGDESSGTRAGGDDLDEPEVAGEGVAPAPAPAEGRRRGGGLPSAAPRRAPRASAGALAPPRTAAEEAAAAAEARPATARSRPRRARSVETGASFTPAELAEASGLELPDVERLEEFGLLTSRLVAGVRCYDEEGLVVARLAAGFARFGVEARHLRTFKHAAEREAGLFEQVVIPLLRQRNPEARSRATDTLEELTELGAALQASLLGAALRDVTG